MLMRWSHGALGGALFVDDGVRGLGVKGIVVEVVHGAGWSWGGERLPPGFEF